MLDKEETNIQDDQSVEEKNTEQAPQSDLVNTYRTQRDNAIRKAHAYATMLKAHGISTENVNDASLQQITIHAGEADSPFEYKAPKISMPAPAHKPRAKSSPQPTLDDVKTWSEDKIADNWDMVKDLMKGNK